MTTNKTLREQVLEDPKVTTINCIENVVATDDKVPISFHELLIMSGSEECKSLKEFCDCNSPKKHFIDEVNQELYVAG